MLCYDFNGFFFLFPKIQIINLFTVSYFYRSISFLKFLPYFLKFLYFFKRTDRLFFLESKINYKITYIKSTGSFGKCLMRNNYFLTILIELPSKARKIFFLTNLAIFKPLVNINKKKNWSNKAGFFINFGKKPTTRGVAKNPVDHPNGGRTKALKCPKTPWGFIAKKK